MTFKAEAVTAKQQGSLRVNPRATRILRRTTAIAVGMCLSLSAAVLPADAQSSAAFDDQSTGVPRPETIPSLDGWKASQGAWTLLPTAHVVSSNLGSRATELAQELSTFTGNTISATTQRTDSSDITLNLDTAQADALGDEGFTLSIGEQGVTISAATEIGVFFRVVIPVSRSAWWAGCKSGRYPKPVKLGPRTTAWRAADIAALLEKLTAETEEK